MSEERVTARARGLWMRKDHDSKGRPCILTCWCIIDGEHADEVLMGRFYLHTDAALEYTVHNLRAAGCTLAGADIWDGEGFGREVEVTIVSGYYPSGRAYRVVKHVQQLRELDKGTWQHLASRARRILGQREPLELKPGPQPRESFEQRARDNARTSKSVEDLPVRKGGWGDVG